MRKECAESLKTIYRRITNFIMLILMTIFFKSAWFSNLNTLMERRFKGSGNVLTIIFYFVILFLFMYVWGGFKLGYQKLVNLVMSQFFAIICTNIVLCIQIILMVGNVYDSKKIVWQLLILTAIDIGICVILSLLFINIYVRLFPPYRVLQINGDYENHLRTKMSNRDDKYQICEEISIHDDELEIINKIKMYDAVLLNDIPTHKKNKILKYCFENSIRVYFTPKISDILVKSTEEINLFDTPLFLCRNVGLSFEQKVIKRLMDIVISMLGIIIASPLILITAIAIKLNDGGPVLFKQKRCTQNGREFWIYKFRSMIVDAEKDGKSRPAIDDDERITTIGRFIRKTRIDELPQLFNILIGDMSFVGPRPERIEHVEKYCADIPEFAYRMKVKGGLTGYAQVYGRYNTTAYDKLKMDLIYISNYSLLLDLQIILETIKVIFRKESTEGFSTEQVKKIRSTKEE